jgi:hypothetical protein
LGKASGGKLRAASPEKSILERLIQFGDVREVPCSAGRFPERAGIKLRDCPAEIAGELAEFLIGVGGASRANCVCTASESPIHRFTRDVAERLCSVKPLLHV